MMLPLWPSAGWGWVSSWGALVWPKNNHWAHPLLLNIFLKSPNFISLPFLLNPSSLDLALHWFILQKHLLHNPGGFSALARVCWHSWEREASTPRLSFWWFPAGMYLCILQARCTIPCGFSMGWREVSCCNNLGFLAVFWRALPVFVAAGRSFEKVLGFPRCWGWNEAAESSWRRDEAFLESVYPTVHNFQAEWGEERRGEAMATPGNGRSLSSGKSLIPFLCHFAWLSLLGGCSEGIFCRLMSGGTVLQYLNSFFEWIFCLRITK